MLEPSPQQLPRKTSGETRASSTQRSDHLCELKERSRCDTDHPPRSDCLALTARDGPPLLRSSASPQSARSTWNLGETRVFHSALGWPLGEVRCLLPCEAYGDMPGHTRTVRTCDRRGMQWRAGQSSRPKALQAPSWPPHRRAGPVCARSRLLASSGFLRGAPAATEVGPPDIGHCKAIGAAPRSRRPDCSAGTGGKRLKSRGLQPTPNPLRPGCDYRRIGITT